MTIDKDLRLYNQDTYSYTIKMVFFLDISFVKRVVILIGSLAKNLLTE